MLSLLKAIFLARYNRATYLLSLSLISAIVAFAVYVDGTAAAAGTFLFIALGNRLHDVGITGWVSVLFFVVINAIALMGETGSLPDEGVGLVGIIFIVGLLILGLIPGEKGMNKWGPQPARGISFKRLDGEP